MTAAEAHVTDTEVKTATTWQVLGPAMQLNSPSIRTLYDCPSGFTAEMILMVPQLV